MVMIFGRIRLTVTVSETTASTDLAPGKGLAGFGTKVESVLSRGIRGYRTEAQAGYENW